LAHERLSTLVDGVINSQTKICKLIFWCASQPEKNWTNIENIKKSSSFLGTKSFWLQISLSFCVQKQTHSMSMSWCFFWVRSESSKMEMNRKWKLVSNRKHERGIHEGQKVFLFWFFIINFHIDFSTWDFIFNIHNSMLEILSFRIEQISRDIRELFQKYKLSAESFRFIVFTYESTWISFWGFCRWQPHSRGLLVFWEVSKSTTALSCNPHNSLKSLANSTINATNNSILSPCCLFEKEANPQNKLDSTSLNHRTQTLAVEFVN
jgi:hypothetical protein